MTSSSSETSSKGWKLFFPLSLFVLEKPSETSSKGWKPYCEADSSGQDRLPKLPLRDGNPLPVGATMQRSPFRNFL